MIETHTEMCQCISTKCSWRKPHPNMPVSGAPTCHGACRQMLPAVYRFVGESFHAGPSALGELTLARALLQALASPFGGLAGLAPCCMQMLAHRQGELKRVTELICRNCFCTPPVAAAQGTSSTESG